MVEQEKDAVEIVLNGKKHFVTAQKITSDESGKNYFRVEFKETETGFSRSFYINIFDLLSMLLKALKDSALNNEIVEEITETLTGIEKIVKVANAKFSAAFTAFKDTKLD